MNVRESTGRKLTVTEEGTTVMTYQHKLEGDGFVHKVGQEMVWE